MAIHCDVCGTRIMAAYENEGGFPTMENFVSKSPFNGNKLNDSCEDCGNMIKQKIKEIVSATVDQIRKTSK